MTPNNTWGLLKKQKQRVSVEPKPVKGFHMLQPETLCQTAEFA